ncbi:hypothetical protein RintRC_5129 [Richelia intracellularis]|nr:hypothetical protein RintRC_5129 [Richelia intracellularis]
MNRAATTKATTEPLRLNLKLMLNVVMLSGLGLFITIISDLNQT